MLKTGDVRTVNRALDKMGLVDVKGMYSVMDQMMDGKIVSDGELPSLLNEMGITSDTYDSSEEVRDKVARFKVNKILKIASGQTNNRAELIRRTAIGLKYGVEEMDNWGEGSIDDLGDTNMNNFSLRTYNTYLTGTKDTIKGDSLGATVQVVTPTIENQIINRPLNTRDVISIKLENLQANEPEQMIDKPLSRIIPWPLENAGEEQITYKRVYNPAHAKWKKDIQIAENKDCLIAFSGRRVVQATVKEELPPDFQTADFCLKHGMIDRIADRKDLAKEIGLLLSLLLKTNSEVNSENNEQTSELSIQTREAS